MCIRDSIITFATAGNERLRIDSSGRAFIGGSSIPSGSSARTLNLISTSAVEAAIVFSRSNSLGGNTTGQDIKLQTNGDLTFDVHNVGEKVRFPAAGGITFNGDTAAANALDDYEEGTWTPAVQFDVGSPTITYGTRAGTYVKVGRMVHLQYYMHIQSGADVNDYFTRLTLPFTGISVGHQDARVRQWNTTHSDWFLSLGGAGPVFFMSNAAGSGVNYARGDDVNGAYLSGQYTLYVS